MKGRNSHVVAVQVVLSIDIPHERGAVLQLLWDDGAGKNLMRSHLTS